MKAIFELIKKLLELLFGNGGVIAAQNNNSGATITEPQNIEAEENESASTVNMELKSNIKILIDNGHGYDTPGKRSPWSSHNTKPEIEFYEYLWNRQIAVPIVEQLCARGYDAEILVPEENDIPLKERVRRVNAICSNLGAKNVVLVSVHSNAAGDGGKWMAARGWEAYTTPGKTNSDTFAEYLYEEAIKNFPKMNIRKDTSDGDSDKEANFYILKYANCPAVLTENFFYDNVDDIKYILSEEGRAAVIKTHVDGIINYIESREQ